MVTVILFQCTVKKNGGGEKSPIMTFHLLWNASFSPISLHFGAGWEVHCSLSHPVSYLSPLAGLWHQGEWRPWPTPLCMYPVFQYPEPRIVGEGGSTSPLSHSESFFFKTWALCTSKESMDRFRIFVNLKDIISLFSINSNRILAFPLIKI